MIRLIATVLFLALIAAPAFANQNRPEVIYDDRTWTEGESSETKYFINPGASSAYIKLVATNSANNPRLQIKYQMGDALGDWQQLGAYNMDGDGHYIVMLGNIHGATGGIVDNYLMQHPVPLHLRLIFTFSQSVPDGTDASADYDVTIEWLAK
jgi:hypothetical protein